MAELDVVAVSYPEGVAPFGGMRLVRHMLDKLAVQQGRAVDYFDGTYITRGERIAQDAWFSSAWMNELVSAEEQHELLNQPFLPFTQKFGSSLVRAFRDSQYGAGWFAIENPAPYTQEFSPSSIVGVGLVRQDVSGSPWEQFLKRRLRPNKIYAAISEIDVTADYEEKGLDIALIDAGMRYFAHTRPDQIPTAYAFEGDTFYLQKLGDLGFAETGVQPRNDLIPGIELTEVRLQADSVHEVRGRISEQYPWTRLGSSIMKQVDTSV